VPDGVAANVRLGTSIAKALFLTTDVTDEHDAIQLGLSERIKKH